MALQFILGRSGSGKSYQLYSQMIRRSKAEPDKNFLVLVPEQFTMQTQRELTNLHPDKGITNIDVLSFLRLAYRIFGETGSAAHGIASMPVLEDTGKNMVLRKLLETMDTELTVFGQSGRKQGFVSELKSLLSEVYQYSVGPEQLSLAVEKLGKKPLLQRKLEDTLALFQAFQSYKENKYITAEEILDILCKVISERLEQGREIRLLQNCVLCLDGYTGFTPSQYALLRILLRICTDMVVTVTLDETVDLSLMSEEFFLFHLSQKTVFKLTEIAGEEGVPVAKPYFPPLLKGVPYRFRESRALAVLEASLFRYGETVFSEEQEDVSVCIQANPAAEAAFVLGEVERLVREEGYRYKDIAVITGDMESYGELFDNTFEAAGIPHFVDYKKGIMKNPLVEFILAALSVVEDNFSYESVMRYLRSGLSGIAADEADLFENYIMAYGIRGGSAYQKLWERPMPGRKPVSAEEEREREHKRESVNLLREILEQRFVPLCAVFQEPSAKKKAEAEAVTRALYMFLTEHRAEERMEEYRREFAAEGEALLEKEYAQVYRLVMELFDKFVALLGEEYLDIEDYRKVLQSGFEELKVGLIPSGLDQIVIGDTNRTRLKDIRALFFAGVNDGIIPSQTASGGILTDMDRAELAGLGIEMAPTARSTAYTEQFYLYLNLTKPTKKLYLTYSRRSADGKAMRPSYLIGKLKRIFAALKERDGETEKPVLRTELRRDGGIGYLLCAFQTERSAAGITREQGVRPLLRFYLPDGQDSGQGDRTAAASKEKKVLSILEGAAAKPLEGRLQKPVAKMLYGELTGSVTRLERYAACAFSHFLSYGLELQERKQFQIAVPDLGNIFHAVLERFAGKLKEKGYRWRDVPEDIRNGLVAESVEEVTGDYGAGVLHSTSRNEAVIRRVRRMAERTVWAACEQLKSGEFEPEAFEVEFSLGLSTAGFHGRIDRIDTCAEGEEELVKIVDYKSGRKAFQLNDFYYGLGLQLVVYLSAAVEEEQRKYPGKMVIPAGIFYYHIHDPILAKPEFTDKTETGAQERTAFLQLLADKRLEELKPSGIVLEAPKILAKFDHTLTDEAGLPVPGAKSKVVPVTLDKEGRPNAYSSVADEKQMKALMYHVNRKLKDFAGAVMEGDASVNPYRKGKETACDYCSYQGICGFGAAEEGRYRFLEELPKDIVWDRICQAAEEGEGEEGEGNG